MPIRIYTTAPARDLSDDRSFGIVAWEDGSASGDAYLIVYLPDGTPVLRGARVELTQDECTGSVEHAMRIRLQRLWDVPPQAQGRPFEELREQIPVEEFVLTQREKSILKGLVGQMSIEAQTEELAKALLEFR